jgi:DNA-binding LytR/AlgR family response regulator
MKVLLIENEKPAADRVIKMLDSIDRSIKVTAVIETVVGTINWLQANDPPDLILMDILLDDGLCFEIFETIKIDIPVIFITAYDEYSIRAFKFNSVDYLLKPVEKKDLMASIQKFRKYHLLNTLEKPGIENLISELPHQYKSRFLVKIGSKYRSIPSGEIRFFHISERSVFLRDITGKDYGLDYSLEQVQKFLDPDKFFRINRECIINIDSVSLMQSYSASRLQIILKDEKENDIFVVSREKVSDFKKWIDR